MLQKKNENLSLEGKERSCNRKASVAYAVLEKEMRRDSKSHESKVPSLSAGRSLGDERSHSPPRTIPPREKGSTTANSGSREGPKSNDRGARSKRGGREGKKKALAKKKPAGANVKAG